MIYDEICSKCGDEIELCFCGWASCEYCEESHCICDELDEDEVIDLVDLMNRSDGSDYRRKKPAQFDLFSTKPQVKAKPKVKPKPVVRYKSVKSIKPVYSNVRVLYFAFGSNMEAGQMKKRCPSALEVSGQYALDGYKLTFCGHSNKWGGGVATIVKSGEGVVLGRLYSLTWSDVFKLDGFEGHPYVYKRQYITLTDGQSVLTYIKPVKNNLNAPSDSYFSTIARGYQQCEYELEKLIDASII